ncbi:MAG TPA: transketolase C-terminal domain-containing protein, partial [Candidatus Omnitrophota bacterium]|nr:transketolase C-terminal domain-containing protein [Candidatus Omnitrophota bacterium]
LCIIATGVMAHRALEVASALNKYSIDAGVVDLFRIKPVNEKLLLGIVNSYEAILTLEEHLIAGGLGSLVSEILSDNGMSLPLRRLGIPDKYYFDYGGRDYLHELCQIDAKSVVDNILKWSSTKALFVKSQRV